MKRRPYLAHVAALTLLVALPALGPTTARAAELIMLEQPGCPWCARFNMEIAPAYAKTDEGRLAPLRRVDITRSWPDDLRGIAPERFTPTFILIEDGIEIGRLRGYPGDEFFWYLLGDLLKKLPQAEHRS